VLQSGTEIFVLQSGTEIFVLQSGTEIFVLQSGTEIFVPDLEHSGVRVLTPYFPSCLAQYNHIN